jgi:hypothetical protein
MPAVTHGRQGFINTLRGKRAGCRRCCDASRCRAQRSAGQGFAEIFQKRGTATAPRKRERYKAINTHTIVLSTSSRPGFSRLAPSGGPIRPCRHGRPARYGRLLRPRTGHVAAGQAPRAAGGRQVSLGAEIGWVSWEEQKIAPLAFLASWATSDFCLDLSCVPGLDWIAVAQPVPCGAVAGAPEAGAVHAGAPNLQ